MQDVAFVYTVGMSDAEVNGRLTAGGTGVLSLARADSAYAVPVPFAYEGDTLRFRLGDDGHSRKLSFAGETEEACFVLHDADENGSWSVVVTGPLRELPEPEWPDTATMNDRFGPVHVFDEAVDELSVTMYELRIETCTGRRTERTAGA